MSGNQTGTQIYVNEIPQDSQQMIIGQSAAKKTNGLGVAGFILALIGLFLGWISVLGWIIWLLGIVLWWIIWLLGIVFSLIGIFKSPRGLAIAGLMLSVISFIPAAYVAIWILISMRGAV